MGSNVARLSVAAAMVTLAAAAGAVVACSSFGSGDGPSSEAGASDAATSDVDADTVDASGGDASCSRYCACQVGAAFCSDFDQAELLGEWDRQSTSDGGVLAPIASDRSSPNALDVSTLASAEANGATVKKTFAGDIAKLSLSFDIAPTMLPLPVGAQASTEFVVLSAVDGTTPVGDLILLMTQSGLKLLANGGTQSTDLPSLPNTRPWVRVHIEVKGALVTVRFDDAPAVAVGAPFPAKGTSVSVRLGLTTAGASGANRVAYDNVVVRFD